MDIAGKRALVTGGNRGIGKAIAAGLRDMGASVVIGARDPKLGAEAAQELGVESVALDLEKPDQIETAVQTAGHFDILINNAGVLYHRPMIDHPQDWRSSLAVMLDAPYQLIRACTPHMAQNGFGRIVNLSSGWGSFAEGLGGPGAYGTHKAALNALTLALSRELPTSIKINAMCPGWVHTRMGGENAPRTPQEGAATALWLASLDEDGPTGGFFRDQRTISW